MKPFICNVTIVYYYIYVLLLILLLFPIFREREIQVLDKGLDFALILNPSYEKSLKIFPGE